MAQRSIAGIASRLRSSSRQSGSTCASRSATNAEDLLAGTGTPDQARHCDLAFSKL
jgi:hypothetical protein